MRPCQTETDRQTDSCCYLLPLPARRYYDQACSFVRVFVCSLHGYARCDFSKTTGPIFTKLAQIFSYCVQSLAGRNDECCVRVMQISETHSFSLALITYTGCVISIICLMLAFATFVCFKSV